MEATKNICGLAVCGGQSSRMGCDKSLISYHAKPQRYHVYDMLRKTCTETFISCSATQLEEIKFPYKTMVDLPAFSSIGPMAALLTGFTHFPQHDLLIVGCDYPFLTAGTLIDFANSINKRRIAAAFCHRQEPTYEPLLAWFSHRAAPALRKLFEKNEHSLQYFLQTANAERYYPEDAEVMQSIDTPEASTAAKDRLGKRKLVTT